MWCDAATEQYRCQPTTLDYDGNVMQYETTACFVKDEDNYNNYCTPSFISANNTAPVVVRSFDQTQNYERNPITYEEWVHANYTSSQLCELNVRLKL